MLARLMLALALGLLATPAVAGWQRSNYETYGDYWKGQKGVADAAKADQRNQAQPADGRPATSAATPAETPAETTPKPTDKTAETSPKPTDGK